MAASPHSEQACVLCGESCPGLPQEDSQLCIHCREQAEALFEQEMRRVELMRTIRGRDVELYDIKHPDAVADKNHCGQLILIKAGQGFEVKICIRSDALEWTNPLHDEKTGFTSLDNRLDALIGNVSLLIESWGGGPHYVDIFYVERVISAEGDI